jgi:hypothetical protein
VAEARRDQMNHDKTTFLKIMTWRGVVAWATHYHPVLEFRDKHIDVPHQLSDVEAKDGNKEELF